MTPDERQTRISSYGQAYDLLINTLDRFPREMWQFRSSIDPWTIHEIIVHIADGEVNGYIRCRHCIAEPGKTVLLYDESRWASALHYLDQRPEDALALFKALRSSTYTLLQALPEHVWQQQIEHPEAGAMTLDDWLVTYDQHVHDHINQMQRIYEAWQREQGGAPLPAS